MPATRGLAGAETQGQEQDRKQAGEARGRRVSCKTFLLDDLAGLRPKQSSFKEKNPFTETETEHLKLSFESNHSVCFNCISSNCFLCPFVFLARESFHTCLHHRLAGSFSPAGWARCHFFFFFLAHDFVCPLAPICSGLTAEGDGGRGSPTTWV